MALQVRDAPIPSPNPNPSLNPNPNPSPNSNQVRDAVLELGGAQTAMTSFRGRGRADWQRMAGEGGAAAAGLD